MFMEKISIEYLIPVLVKLGEDNHLCMFDYARSNVYFLDQSLSEEKKKYIQDAALRMLVGDNLKEYKFNDNPLSNIGGLLSDLNSGKFEEYRDLKEKEEKEENG